MSQKSQKYGAKSQNYGQFFPNARIYRNTRINTGDFSTLVSNILYSNAVQPINEDPLGQK